MCNCMTSFVSYRHVIYISRNCQTLGYIQRLAYIEIVNTDVDLCSIEEEAGVVDVGDAEVSAGEGEGAPGGDPLARTQLAEGCRLGEGLSGGESGVEQPAAEGVQGPQLSHLRILDITAEPPGPDCEAGEVVGPTQQLGGGEGHQVVTNSGNVHVKDGYFCPSDQVSTN